MALSLLTLSLAPHQLGFDHHCAVLNCCIAQRNHRDFVGLLCAVCVGGSVPCMHTHTFSHSFSRTHAHADPSRQCVQLCGGAGSLHRPRGCSGAMPHYIPLRPPSSLLTRGTSVSVCALGVLGRRPRHTCGHWGGHRGVARPVSAVLDVPRPALPANVRAACTLPYVLSELNSTG